MISRLLAAVLMLLAIHGCAKKPGVGLPVAVTSGARVAAIPDSGLFITGVTVQPLGWTWPIVPTEETGGDTILTSIYTGSGTSDLVPIPPYARYLQFKKMVWRNTDTLHVHDATLSERMVMSGYLLYWGMALWGDEYLFFNATKGSKWQVILIR